MTTPLLLQMHMTECGAACLGSILAYFGLQVTLTELRDRCEISRDGSSAGGIKRAAEHYGLNCIGRRIQAGALDKISLPLVILWEMNHFLILEGYDQNRFYLNDPASGRRTLTPEEFSLGYSGVALEFEPGSGFQPGGRRLGLLKRMTVWLRGTLKPLILVITCGALLVIPTLMTPALLAVFVDHVLGETDKGQWTAWLLVLLLAAAALSYVLVLLKYRWLNRLAVRLAVASGDRYVSKMLRLPIEFFTHRLLGDLISRILSIDRISQTLSVQLFELLSETIVSAILFAAILFFSLEIALVLLFLAVLNVLLTSMMARERSDRSVSLRREQGLLLGIGTVMLNQGETARMTATDDRFFSRWSGHQAREVAAYRNLSELNYFSSAWTPFFDGLSHAAVLVIGGLGVIAGDLSIGGLIGIFLLSSLFLTPVGRIVEFANGRQAVEADIQRLDDIVDSSTDTSSMSRYEHTGDVPTLEGRLKLAGRVELRNVSFGYNRSRKPIIENFSLSIEPGQRIAIVGSSGSGKSTLSRIVSGFYEPWSGEILLDGYPRSEIPPEVLSNSISLVDQRTVLFPSSVLDNITLWNSSVPEEAVLAAAKDACIHEDILCRSQGYETDVAESGENFSGGQRQRIGIARALAGEPTILVLDEATSSLDTTTEEAIDLALRRRGITCLMIAHRLSTIRDCDQIIVLKHGVEVERGTHEQLIQDTNGAYYQLVRSE